MERIQHYEVVRLLGSGGFGVVFEVRDPEAHERPLAIKVLHAELARDDEVAARFFQEALVLARLDHPSIPRVHSFGPWKDTFFLVQDLVRGETVSELFRDRRATAQEAADLLRGLLSGMAYAHRKGVIHRDLKPENLVLAPDGLKLLDFGLARILEGGHLSRSGTFLGSVPYAAPEQLRGGRGDARADIFSAGVILFWLLTGRWPRTPAAPDLAGAIAEQLAWADGGDRSSLRGLVPGVPEALDRFFRVATAGSPDQRYQSADEALAALDEAGPATPFVGAPAASPGFELRAEAIFDRGCYPDAADPLVKVLVSVEASGAPAVGTEVRADVFLVLDVSGSMNTPAKYPLLRRAVDEFLARMAASDRVGIVLFSTAAEQLTPLIAGATAAAESSRLLARMDSSQLLWGGTNLAPGLRLAQEGLTREGPGKGVSRVYVLTDGEIYDAPQCQGVLEGFRESRIEVSVYGFGSGFNATALKQLVSDQLGGAVKPICNERDIIDTFAHIAAVNQRLVAEDGLLSFDVDPGVDVGDAWTFRPQERHLGAVRHRRVVREMGGVESGRVYSLLLELRLPPDEGRAATRIGRVSLSCRRGGARLEVGHDLLAPRAPGGEELEFPEVAQVEQAYLVLDAMRQGGKEAELAAARARLALARSEGRDPGLVEALQKNVDVLEGRRSASSLGAADRQYLASDMNSCMGSLAS
jgi:hypothetical protein